ncbi:MAG TPA: anti-sigma factor antagonist [Spartobacteria bacterium]|jgi:anti-sigma B factor antagonist|nr:anti-sigma factor antagonist [Spartobacteria bacterium]
MSLPESGNVLSLKGQIDLHVSPQVAASLGAIIDQEPSRVVVDLSGVSYIDSSGLAALINGAKSVETYGGRFMLAGVQDDVRSILERAGLSQFFLIFPHVDAALAAT